MSTNLVYNGDFSHGTDSWYTTGNGTVAVSNGAINVSSGDLFQDVKYLFPVANGRKYKLSFDLIVHSKATQPFYIALRCYDNNKQHINIAHTNNTIANAQTTLSSVLNNGDTTVSLTDATNFPTNRTYQGIGICNKLAWGYNRCTYRQPYTSKNGNVITLKSAWAGGSFPAGTKVAEFEDGSTYYYPYIIANANLPTEWTTYECEFYGGNPMRYSTQYVQFGTLGYTHNYSMRNIKLECISDLQEIDWDSYNSDIKKTGIIDAKHFNEVGAKIRYVRDWMDGNTANTNSHWNEFKIFNSIGENIAWGKDIRYGSNNTTSGTLSNSVATDGVIDSQWVAGSSGNNAWGMIDLGYIEEIHKIHIWHYYPDGRTYYNNRVEVSSDGENWWTVYSGQKPETVNGNEIIVTNPNVQIYQNGEIKAHEFYEY